MIKELFKRHKRQAQKCDTDQHFNVSKKTDQNERKRRV